MGIVPERCPRVRATACGRLLRRIDTPVERMWIVVIRWRPFFLTFDDFPLGLSLDSMSRWCNPVIKDLFLELGGSPR